MIVVDSSILVGIIKGEADAEQVLDLLATDAWAVGAPTLVETRAWCAINLVARSSHWLDGIIGADGVSVVRYVRSVTFQTRSNRLSVYRTVCRATRAAYGDAHP